MCRLSGYLCTLIPNRRFDLRGNYVCYHRNETEGKIDLQNIAELWMNSQPGNPCCLQEATEFKIHVNPSTTGSTPSYGGLLEMLTKGSFRVFRTLHSLPFLMLYLGGKKTISAIDY